MFRLLLIMAFFAAILSVITGAVRADWNRVLLSAVLIIPVIVFCFNYMDKTHKLDMPAIIVSIILNCILLPLGFFTNHGVKGGTTGWFLVGIIYIFLVFRGKLFHIMLAMTFFVIIGIHYVAYKFPEFVIRLSGEERLYFDSVLSIVLVGCICGILIRYQNKIYAMEKEMSEQQKQEIEQLSRSRNAFFTNMSHEIRTPINTIIGLNEMTLRENISDEIAENSINIQNASKMLLTLINDILDMSKIESGKMEIVPVQYETGAMFSDLVNIIWIRAYEKKLEFKIDIDEDIPSMLYGDEVRIKQVLTNILSNAVKYTKKGSVTLSAQSEKIHSNRVRLRISVSDTGMGIRKEDIDNLFHSFSRVDEEKNRGVEGTGLGLAISKQLTEMMGGKITVDSIYTKGSVFTITLDQQIVDGKPIGSMDFMLKRKVIHREQYKQRFEAPDAKVLVVDDNEMNRLVASKLLRSTKVQLDMAASGKECLEMTRHKLYHVIFMDHMMPEMDGIETLKQIRMQENGLCKDVPVVALTAHAMSGAEQIYMEKGFQGYLPKPINGALLEAVLLKYLPEELIEASIDAEELLEERKTIKLISEGRKKAIAITTDCVSDLPLEWLLAYDIKSMYYYVHTNKGSFCDVKEISSDNLLRYLETEGNTAHSECPSISEYENFFANALEDAESVIHISITSRASKGYETALSASTGFGNVKVIDSGHLSSGMGIMVMFAAQLAKEGCSQEHICKSLKELRERISTSFIVPSPENLYRNGKINKTVRNVCEVLDLHPVLALKQKEMVCSTMKIGRIDHAYKSYIRQEMKNKKIDKRLLFITYAGCSVKTLEAIKKEVEKYIHFEKVVFQKASASISSNCGLGAFGLIYMKKK